MAGAGITITAANAGRVPDVYGPALRQEHDKVVADLDALHAAFLALTAKLDLDGGVTGTDFAALTDPAAITAGAITVTAS